MPNGIAAAAILGAAIGVFALGLLTFLAEVNSGIARLLNFYPPAGPLSGKTTMAVVVWLVAWAVTHQAWRDREVNFGAVFGGSLLLIGLGLLLMFPPVFELFAG